MTQSSGRFSALSQENGEASDGEQVDGPSHYTSHPSGIEAIEVTKHEDFLIGNVLKYLWRRKFKGQELVDLKKARYYLELAIQQLEQDSNNAS